MAFDTRSKKQEEKKVLSIVRHCGALKIFERILSLGAQMSALAKISIYYGDSNANLYNANIFMNANNIINLFSKKRSSAIIIIFYLF